MYVLANSVELKPLVFAAISWTSDSVTNLLPINICVLASSIILAKYLCILFRLLSKHRKQRTSLSNLVSLPYLVCTWCPSLTRCALGVHPAPRPACVCAPVTWELVCSQCLPQFYNWLVHILYSAVIDSSFASIFISFGTSFHVTHCLLIRCICNSSQSLRSKC